MKRITEALHVFAIFAQKWQNIDIILKKTLELLNCMDIDIFSRVLGVLSRMAALLSSADDFLASVKSAAVLFVPHVAWEELLYLFSNWKNLKQTYFLSTLDKEIVFQHITFAAVA